MIIPVILAGGSGTRLWPLSRALYPKQLLDLVDEKTMLQNTLLRLKSAENVGDPIVVCNQDHRFMVAEQLRAIDQMRATIALEPVGRNTAPAVAAAAAIAESIASDPFLLILPADHHIDDTDALVHALKAAKAQANQDYLVTFGIVPQSPETGYGYIRRGQEIGCIQKEDDNAAVSIYSIEQFVEKPDLATARNYVDSGEYFWNSGMFLFRSSAFQRELQEFASDIAEASRAAVEKGTTDLDFFRLDQSKFADCRSDSIDYAVMEKTRKGAMVALDAGWNDLGSWEALWQAGKKDEFQNVVHGDVLVEEVKNSYLYAQNRLIAAVGIENHVVVETSDAVLLAPKNRVQDVKRIVNRLKAGQRHEAYAHKRIYRPWGSYETIDTSDRFQVKRITVKPGARLSMQKHFHRAEHWIVVKGTAKVEIDGKSALLREDESIYIPLGAAHRLINPGKIPLDLIEVRTGSYLAEDDIVRIEDDYGR